MTVLELKTLLNEYPDNTLVTTNEESDYLPEVNVVELRTPGGKLEAILLL